MKHLKPKNSLESFLVMILLVCFAFGSLLIIFESQQAFERVSNNKTRDEQTRIALSYIEKRVKQAYTVKPAVVEGIEGIAVTDDFFSETYIFVYEDQLFECYTDEIPTLELSTKVADVKEMTMSLQDHQLQVEMLYEYHGKDIHIEQIISLRGEKYE